MQFREIQEFGPKVFELAMLKTGLIRPLSRRAGGKAVVKDLLDQPANENSSRSCELSFYSILFHSRQNRLLLDA